LRADEIVDADVVDTITASNYLLLAGGTLTGEVVVDNLGLEFTKGDDHADCSAFSATGGGIFFDDSEGIFKKCQDNVLTSLYTGASTAYDSIADPTGAGSIVFGDTETATYTSATTATDQFNFIATGAFGDISIVKIDQNTGDATNGTMLEIATDDADVDHLMLIVGAADYVTHKIVDAGTYTIDVTSDGTAAVDVVDGLTAGSLTSDAGLAIADAGNIGSASDSDSIAIDATGNVTFSQNVVVSGTGIELNHATANTLTASGGVLSIEGNVVHHTGGADVADADIADDITLATTKDVTLTLADPDILFVDSTTSGEANIAISDAAGPDGIMDLQVDEAGTLTSYIQIDGANETVDILKALTTASTSDFSAGAVTLGTISGTINAGGATALEIPNGTVDPAATTGSIALDTDGTDADYTGPVIAVSTNGATMGYVFTMTDMPAAAEDNYIPKYNAATNLFVWEPDAGGNTAWDDLTVPDANESLDMTTYTTTWDFGGTSDMFTIQATAAFADVSVVHIQQLTGDPTNGTLLELTSNDANVDHLSIASDAAAYTTFTQANAGGLTINVTSDGGAVVSILDDLAIGSNPADAGAGIRMSNNSVIEFEDTEGTGEVTALQVDASEAILIGDANASGVTITPATTVSG
jgi:hypothetical protein